MAPTSWKLRLLWRRQGLAAGILLALQLAAAGLFFTTAAVTALESAGGNVARAVQEQHARNGVAAGQRQQRRLAATTTEATSAGVKRRLLQIPAGCFEIEGYTALVNADHTGDDIVQVDILSAASACSADPKCKGFNSDGWLKFKVTPSKWKPEVCLYVKILPPPPPRRPPAVPRPPPSPPSPPSPPPTVCAKIDGYTVKADADHAGDNITSYGSIKNLTLAAATCSADATCKGFNSGGLLKTSVVPTKRTNGICLYSKRPGSPRPAPPSPPPPTPVPPLPAPPPAAVCQAIAGFTGKPDVDHDGDDLAIFKNLTLAAQYCLASQTCKGFNSDGWAKSAVVPTAKRPGYCLYTKIPPPPSPPSPPPAPPAPPSPPRPQAPPPTVCERVPGYTARADLNHPGDDLYIFGDANDDSYNVAAASALLAEAAQRCETQLACVGFNMLGVLKSAVMPVVRAPGFCLYVRNPTVCKPIAGYTVTADVDCPGNEITNAGSAASAAAACKADAECAGFNAHGWTLSTVTPTQPSRGNCLYTKIQS